MTIDDLHARVPANATAARVVASGVHYEPGKKITDDESELPIPTMKIPAYLLRKKSFTDLTGVRFGRFTVIGWAARLHKKWVCRCVCGRYTTRTTRAVKNPENIGDRCGYCRQLAYLKKREIWTRTGVNVDIRTL